jgi:GNAT superfamily N-acetyltransferase
MTPVAIKKRPVDSFHPPEPIQADHDLDRFQCGEPSLDEWLRRRALRNEMRGGSRTYVVCSGSGSQVVAYYCLAVGAIAHIGALGRVRRNMPDPIPAMIVGRLAVDQKFQGQGLGGAMLRDATLRTIQAASIAGIRAILVHATSASAKRFYERAGFRSSSIDPMTLMVTLEEAERSLAGKR